MPVEPVKVPDEIKALGEMAQAWDYLAPFLVPKIREALKLDDIKKQLDRIEGLLTAIQEGLEE